MATDKAPLKPTKTVWCLDLQQFKHVAVCAKCKDKGTCKEYQEYISPRLAI